MSVENETVRSDLRVSPERAPEEGDAIALAARAREQERRGFTARAEGWFVKRNLLASDEGFFHHFRGDCSASVATTCRTVFFEDAAMTVTVDGSATQIVRITTGTCSKRAVPLAFSSGQVSLYEIDVRAEQPVGCEMQKPILGALLSPAERSSRQHRVIPVDSQNPPLEHAADPTGHWTEMLVNAGFDPNLPSVWMMEGLTYRTSLAG